MLARYTSGKDDALTLLSVLPHPKETAGNERPYWVHLHIYSSAIGGDPDYTNHPTVENEYSPNNDEI